MQIVVFFVSDHSIFNWLQTHCSSPWLQVKTPLSGGHKLRKMLLLIARLSTSLSFFSSLILVPWLLIIKIALLRCCCGLFVYSNEHLMANSKLVRCHIHTHAHTHRGKAKENRERASKKVRGREIQIGLTCSDFPFRFCTSPFSLIWFLLHFSQFISMSVVYFFPSSFFLVAFHS